MLLVVLNIATYLGFQRVFTFYDANVNKADNIFIAAGVLYLSNLILYFLEIYLIYYFTLVTNSDIHAKMTRALVRAPIPYFDSVPAGRIINRFSTDVGIMDVGFPFGLVDSLEGPTIYLGIMISIIIDSPWTAIPVVFLTLVIFYIVFQFKEVINWIRKCELESRSPVFSFFTNTMAGILQVKTYRKKPYFLEHMSKLINNYSKYFVSYMAVTRGMAFFMNMITSTISTFGLFLIVHLGRSNPSLIGLASSYLSQASNYLHYFAKQMMVTGSSLVSASRMIGLTRIDQ